MGGGPGGTLPPSDREMRSSLIRSARQEVVVGGDRRV